LKNARAADAVAARFSGVRRLLVNKYFVDELYESAIVRPIRILSEQGLWKAIDARVIDGVVNGVGKTVEGGAQVLRRAQTGSVRVYAAFFFAGAVVILGYYLWP